jgi:hypothetical protein
MFDRVTVLELIDRAFEEQPFCESCGEPTILRSEDDAVILECSGIGRAGIRARIADFLMPHTRRVVIDRSEDRAA